MTTYRGRTTTIDISENLKLNRKSLWLKVGGQMLFKVWYNLDDLCEQKSKRVLLALFWPGLLRHRVCKTLCIMSSEYGLVPLQSIQSKHNSICAKVYIDTDPSLFSESGNTHLPAFCWSRITGNWNVLFLLAGAVVQWTLFNKPHTNHLLAYRMVNIIFATSSRQISIFWQCNK